MKNIKTSRYAGFTMVELLIAIIIIGILVTIIVPVLTNRAADARIAAAKADMEAIANAESQVAIDTGYVVRLHVLDDSGAIGDGIGSDGPNDVVDSIGDEEFNNASGPEFIFLDAKTGAFLPNNLYTRAKNNPEQFGWRGPYLNYQRKIKGLPTPLPIPAWTVGSPVDPWGNPYFLFVAGRESGSGAAEGGWINEQAGSISETSFPDSTFDYGGGTPADATRFDRMTLLSLGPDGQVGDGTNNILGSGDDLVRAF